MPSTFGGCSGALSLARAKTAVRSCRELCPLPRLCRGFPSARIPWMGVGALPRNGVVTPDREGEDVWGTVPGPMMVFTCYFLL